MWLTICRRCFTRMACGALREEHISKKVDISGWVHFSRMRGRYIALRDRAGIVQIVNTVATVEEYPLETVLRIKGVVIKRPDGAGNANLATGAIEVIPEKIEVLNTCERLPIPVAKQSENVSEDNSMMYRYIALRHESLQQNLKFRSQFVHKLRCYLHDNDFLELETPYLFRRTKGGSREFVVPTAKAGLFYALTQSPQQLKQLLMVGGVGNYFQVARCFRDETGKADRQPEFSQIDLEMSFAEPEDVRRVIEGALSAGLPSLTTPIPMYDYSTLMRDYGSDKPDLRFPWKIQRLSADVIAKKCPDFNNAVDLDVMHIPMNGAVVDKRLMAKLIGSVTNKFRGTRFSLATVRYEGNWHFHSKVNLPVSVVEAIREMLPVSHSDIVIVSPTHEGHNETAIGRCRNEISKFVGRNDDSLCFYWISGFPLFIRNDDEQLEACHHPFTAPIPEHVPLLHDPTRWEEIEGQQFDLVLNGREVGGGSARIHNAELQRIVFDDILGLGSDQMDYFIEALKSGAPPHAGIALGVERLVAAILGEPNVRQVMAFPKNSQGHDLMSHSPALLTRDDLEYYHQT